jgi:hypothetical protein
VSDFKFKVGDRIYCICSADCGINGVITNIGTKLVEFEDGGVEFTPHVNKYYVSEEVYNSQLMKALRED